MNPTTNYRTGSELSKTGGSGSKLNQSLTNSGQGSRTNSMLSPNKNGLITREEFVALDPNDIEVFVVKPVKKIAALLSHVVIYHYYYYYRNICSRSKSGIA